MNTEELKTFASVFFLRFWCMAQFYQILSGCVWIALELEVGGEEELFSVNSLDRGGGGGWRSGKS